MLRLCPSARIQDQNNEQYTKQIQARMTSKKGLKGIAGHLKLCTLAQLRAKIASNSQAAHDNYKVLTATPRYCTWRMAVWCRNYEDYAQELFQDVIKSAVVNAAEDGTFILGKNGDFDQIIWLLSLL